jgi:hypothetical protein
VRVRCIKLIETSGPNRGAPIAEFPHLAVGEEFHVLSVHFDPRAPDPWKIAVQILDRESTPTWWPIEMFETSSSAIPENWIIQIRSTGSLHIAPRDWLVPGFWERYFDHPVKGSEADSFRAEVDLIMRADSTP